MRSKPLTVGSLFAGIGGFDLGAERAGLTVKWQVEIDPFCRRVLEKHWPHVRRYEDVREVHGEGAPHSYFFGRCYRCLEPVDVLVGGFPCQDISFAGDGAGLDGDRSGLWFQMDRLIGELRPLGLRYIVVENVAALLKRGLERVLGNLADRGFDAEWSCVSACSVGQTHMRQRLFIVAHANGEHGRPWLRDSVARAFRPLQAFNGFASARTGALARMADPSALYRGADGVPDGSHRNRGVGNSVDPHVAEWIFRRIIEADGEAQGFEASTD